MDRSRWPEREIKPLIFGRKYKIDSDFLIPSYLGMTWKFLLSISLVGRKKHNLHPLGSSNICHPTGMRVFLPILATEEKENKFLYPFVSENIFHYHLKCRKKYLHND